MLSIVWGLCPQMELVIPFWSIRSAVKNSPVKQETQIQSLGQEDPLEKEMATHSNILAWQLLWIEESGVLQSMGLQELDMG